MKKTIIALFALAGMAAAANPTVYTDVKFADNDSTSLTGERSHIIFGDTSAATPLTLSSWMIEFDVTKFADGGVMLAISPSDSGKGNDFCVRTHGGTKVGIMFSNGTTSFYGTPDDPSSEIFVTNANISDSTPLTLRVAYDDNNNMAYLYDATNKKLISYGIDATLPLSSVANSHNGDDINYKTQFYCQGNPVGSLNY